MDEPTRYEFSCGVDSVCYADEDSLGNYILYSDYAALRAKAEAVVREYDDYNFNKMVDRIAELKEHLNGTH